MSIESIKARLEAASEGPWVEWTDCLEKGYIIVGNEEGALTEDRPFTEDADYYALVCTHEDADFIAHAPTDLRALLAMAEAAKKVDRLCGWPNGDPDITQASALGSLRKALAAVEEQE